MKWSSKFPAELGYHWCRYKSLDVFGKREPFIVEIRISEQRVNGFEIWFIGWDIPTTVRADHIEEDAGGLQWWPHRPVKPHR